MFADELAYFRNETGFDPGGQYCPKYRVQVLSRG